VVTHDIHVAERCFHIINMRDGEIVSESVTDRGRARAGGAVVR
jgi:ABC-type lipoprotein export system ATPase subunit